MWTSHARLPFFSILKSQTQCVIYSCSLKQCLFFFFILNKQSLICCHVYGYGRVYGYYHRLSGAGCNSATDLNVSFKKETALNFEQFTTRVFITSSPATLKLNHTGNALWKCEGRIYTCENDDRLSRKNKIRYAGKEVVFNFSNPLRETLHEQSQRSTTACKHWSRGFSGQE